MRRTAAMGALFLLLACSLRVSEPPASGEAATASGGPQTSAAAATSSAPVTSPSSSASSTTTTSTTSGSTTPSTTSSTTDETDDPGSNFIEDPDVGLGSECRPMSQDCPDGFKCVWYVAGEAGLRRKNARCIPVTGDVAPFEPCSLPNGIGPDITDDCGAESFCFEVYGLTDQAYCAPFFNGANCNAYPGTMGAGENGSDFPAACLRYPCHPLDSSTCPEGSRCMFYPAFLYGNAMCWNEAVPPDLPLGTACEYDTCGPGKMCAPEQWLPDREHERCESAVARA